MSWGRRRSRTQDLALPAVAGVVVAAALVALGFAGDAASGSGEGTIRLAMAQGYVPKVSATMPDDYHCFVLDPKLDRDVVVTAAGIEPGVRAMVHHVVLFKFSGSAAQAVRRRDRATGGRGWTCFGGPNVGAGGVGGLGGDPGDALDDAPWLTAWVPGRHKDALPPGTGISLPRGSLLVMQVHYNAFRSPRADRTRVTLRTAPSGSKLRLLTAMLLPAPVELHCPEGATAPLCDRQAALAEEIRKYGPEAGYFPQGLLLLCGKSLGDFPARVGDASRIETSCSRTVNHPVTIYAAAGHMHLRGREIRIELLRAGAPPRTLLHVPRWDFNWQDVRYLDQPVGVRQGDTLRVTCTFDNSTKEQPVIAGKRLAPRYVLWGEGTTDEMCIGVLQVARGAPARTP